MARSLRCAVAKWSAEAPMQRFLRLLLTVMLVAGLSATGSPGHVAPLPNDAYVWQRLWTPALVSAVRNSADLVRQWRVLAAEMGGGGHFRPVAADLSTLAATGRPVVAVVRIDGQLTDWQVPATVAAIAALAERWREGPAQLVGIEIDHDCATARLPAYATFLATLRARLDQGLLLSITALPTWFGSSDLDRVLAVTDEIVLQVHAVQSPLAGLFDVRRATGWIDAMATRTTKPFLVALPAYGARINWDGDGHVLSVESERPLLAGSARTSELTVAPAEVAGLLARLNDASPPHLAGVVWFRLSTGEDRRAWSLATWRAVVSGQPLTGRIEARTEPSATAGMLDLMLANPGDTDAILPRRVVVAGGCVLGDGINGYRLERQASALAFVQDDAGLLGGQAQRTIGWLRCGGDGVTIDVEP